MNSSKVSKIYSLIITFSVLNTCKSLLVKPHLQITGGQDAPIDAFPFQVGIESTTTATITFCSGTIISNTWILSTANCVYHATFSKVYIGEVHLKMGIKHTILRRNIVIHPGYIESSKINDIALIPIPYTTFSQFINKVKLPRDDNDRFENVGVIASGWAMNAIFQAPILQYAPFYTMTNAECSAAYQYNIAPGQMCIRTLPNRSPCHADAGGPALHRSSYGIIQIGILSFSPDFSCTLGSPYALTRISKHLEWIRGITGIPDTENDIDDENLDSKYHVFDIFKRNATTNGNTRELGKFENADVVIEII